MRWPWTAAGERRDLNLRVAAVEAQVDRLTTILNDLGLVDAAAVASRLREPPDIDGTERACTCDHIKEAHRHDTKIIGSCKVRACRCVAYDPERPDYSPEAP